MLCNCAVKNAANYRCFGLYMSEKRGIYMFLFPFASLCSICSICSCKNIISSGVLVAVSGSVLASHGAHKE